MSNTQIADTLWDPFHGNISFIQQTVEEPSKTDGIPAIVSLINKFGTPLIFIGFLLTFAGLLFQNLIWIGIPSVVLGFGFLFITQHLKKTEQRISWLLFNVARKNNWAFEVIPPIGENNLNPRMRPVYQRAGELFKMKVARMTTIKVDAFCWGKTKQDVPFWIGIGLIEADMTFAVGSLKKDKHGNKGNKAYVINMVCAYQLDRETGIRARLLHESITGENKRDFQTESVEFNRQFNISIADVRGNPPENVSAQEMALLQALSPATQATLISLKDQYDVQVVIDGDTIFYAGWEKLNTEDFDVISKHIDIIVEAFAESAVSFKHYVE